MRSTTITIHTIGDHPEYYLREVSKQLQAGATEGKLDRYTNWSLQDVEVPQPKARLITKDEFYDATGSYYDFDQSERA
jgi:hypothetical protein